MTSSTIFLSLAPAILTNAGTIVIIHICGSVYASTKGHTFMGFEVPQMPLTFNAWHHANGAAPVGPPDVTGDCNLAWGKRVAVPSTGGTGFVGVPLFTMTLLVVVGTDLRDRLEAGGSDTVEVPAGSGRMYECVYVDDLGKGFANEHRGAILYATIRPYPLP